jgi:hypothetical protein
MKKLLISSAILLALAPLQASYGFRCQGRLVNEGDTKSEVLKKCGEPTGKDSRESEVLKKAREPIGKNSREQEVMNDVNAYYKDIITVDVWLYNLGSNKFVRLLQFKNNQLVSIKTRGYGKSCRVGKVLFLPTFLIKKVVGNKKTLPTLHGFFI